MPAFTSALIAYGVSLFFGIAPTNFVLNSIPHLTLETALQTALLGIAKPVIKAHGSSDARAIRNAVFRAVEYAQSGIIADVEAHIDVMKVEKNG